MWPLFGLTILIDITTHLIHRGKPKRIDPYNPVRSVSVIVPVHKEGRNIEPTISSLYSESYPLKNVIVCGDPLSKETEAVVKKLCPKYNNLIYIECPQLSKAKKINYVISKMKDILGEFVYIRDARVIGNADCIERIISYFYSDKVAAVTSYGRLSAPKNLLAKSYYYGKAWVDEIGRFRKRAQEKRKAVFVLCGASTMFRTKVLEAMPIPSKSKTEDTHYTWQLQIKGFKVGVADDATVSAPDVDGEYFKGVKGQLKQSFRWISGTMQCFYIEGRNIPRNKRLFFTTIIPGFVESTIYSIAVILAPVFLFISPILVLGFFIGDTVFSLGGTLIIIPKKFVKTVLHYPQICFFKYLNSLVFMSSIFVVSAELITGRMRSWSNEWRPPSTKIKRTSVSD